MKFEEPKMEIIYTADVVVASSVFDENYAGENANCNDGWSNSY